ncbi:Six-hairpin glycosidase [Piromyces finnis]|uniref:cellulase n=1 Tax=Piromyces finnis TaxID=1754191 RepID=A0A1Y1V420_9FUNG|nr:Six-hairpin glycosidase [Piromyces finnis]|eukprot:ORX46831.1 Six-hairpin glycosidase [Piromyces finnis]
MKISKIISTIFICGPALIKAASKDYAHHLELSIQFYRAQRSGILPVNNDILWHQDIDSTDDIKVDLTGGYNGNNNVKFNFPQASSLTLLAWGALEWKDGYKKAGQWDDMKELLQWGTDYLIKCHTDKYVLYGQVGNDNSWNNPSYKITESAPGSDLAAETSAALVAASLVFKDEYPIYADHLLQHGKELYEFANKYRGDYDVSIPDAKLHYPSRNGFIDELAWSAAWLYKATGEKVYKKDIDEIWDYPYDESNPNKFLGSKNPISYYDKKASSYVLMAITTGEKRYFEEALTHSDFMVNHPTTSGDLWYDEQLSQEGANKYASNAAFTVAMMTSLMKEKDSKRQQYMNFVKKQIDYMLGDNPEKIDFVVGANTRSSKVYQKLNTFGSNDENEHLFYGALTDFKDKETNVVAFENNAAFQGLLAFLSQNGFNLSDSNVVPSGNIKKRSLVRRAGNAEVVSGKDYAIMVVLSGKYITAASNGNVHQWENLSDNSQVWRFESAGNGKFAILSGQNHKLAMTVENGNSKNGNNIYLSEYKNTADQRFILHEVEGAYYITAECSGNAALDVYDISYDNGANIDQWDYWGGDGQKFYILNTGSSSNTNSGGAYLFTYFLGNAPEQERLSYAVSTDGYHFKALNNGKEVWKSSVGTGCLRDPYIFKGKDGYYYLLATDMKSALGWNSNRNILSAKSSDLIHWTNESSIEIANKYPLMQGADRAWAPQAIYDPEKDSYMIYFAARVPGRDNRTIMYYAYSKNMQKLDTAPQLLFAPSNGNDAIDSDIIFQNNKYYMYYKNETNKRIYLATASHASGPYSEIKQVSEGNIGVEGPNIYQLQGTNKWLMMSDAYGNGYYVMQETTDLVNFKTVNRNSYSFNFTPRHGYVIPINSSQYNALLSAYPSNGIAPLNYAVKPSTTTTIKKTMTTTIPTTSKKTTTTVQAQPTHTTTYSCFSEEKKLGYPCCKYCTIIESDSYGDYGVENNAWCSISYACYENQNQDQDQVNGYSYCKTTTTIVYTDDVNWGVENNDWCIIKSSVSTCSCWSESLGYPCCHHQDIIYTDESGPWGLENNQWCGIQTC